LSEICKIRNVWNFPAPFSRNTLIPRSEKISWSLKISFWMQNCPINSKTVMKYFSPQGLPYKSLDLNFMVLGHPNKKFQNYRKPYT
jgi:hypothetical protein